MSSEEHYRKLERMYASARINEFFEPVLEVSEGRADLTLKVHERFLHAAHAVHGSVYFKALDDAAWFAVNSLVEDVFVLTVSFNIYLVRPIARGVMKAGGRVVHQSRRLYIAESTLTDERGRQLARGSGSFMSSETPLSPEVGYE
jgi:uncharacterized protein (TIGR00369 family)